MQALDNMIVSNRYNNKTLILMIFGPGDNVFPAYCPTIT